MPNKYTGPGGRTGKSHVRPKLASEMEAEILKLSQEIAKEAKTRKRPQYVRKFPIDPLAGKLGRGRLRKALPDHSKRDRLNSLMRRLKIEDENRFEELEEKLAKIGGPRGVRRLRLKREIVSRAKKNTTATTDDASRTTDSNEGEEENSFDFFKLEKMASEADEAISEANDLIRRMNFEMREKPDGSN